MCVSCRARPGGRRDTSRCLIASRMPCDRGGRSGQLGRSLAPRAERGVRRVLTPVVCVPRRPVRAYGLRRTGNGWRRCEIANGREMNRSKFDSK